MSTGTVAESEGTRRRRGTSGAAAGVRAYEPLQRALTSTALPLPDDGRVARGQCSGDGER